MLALALALTMGHLAPAADTSAIVAVTQELRLELAPGRAEWRGSLRAELRVRRTSRRFALRLANATPARVELVDAHGAIRLNYGWRGRDTLLVEAAESLAPGSVGLNVEWIGSLATTSRGPRAAGPGVVELVPGAGGTLPCWPGTQPATPWRVVVTAPDTCVVRCSLPFHERSRQGRWRTWEFGSARALPADSIALSVRVRPKATARTRDGAARRGPPRR